MKNIMGNSEKKKEDKNGNRIVKTRKKRVAVVRRVEWEIVKILALKGL
jgi:hypothetical protein